MRLLGIDILRGFAVTVVVIYHFFVLFHLEESLYYTYAYALGQLGVPLFFIISGYLIYRSIDYNVSSKGIKNGLKSYTIHRLFRIFPAYYVNLFIIFILAFYLFHTIDTWPIHFIKNQIFSHLTLTSYFFYQTSGFEINGVYWTLSIELLWYIIAPLLYLYFKKDIFYFILFILALFYFLSIDLGLFDFLFHLDKKAPNYLAKLFFFSFQLPGQIIYFITGIFIYKYSLSSKKLNAYYLWSLFLFLLILFTYLSSSSYFLNSFLIRNIVTLFIVSSIFVLFYQKDIKKLFLLSWLGEISYSIYLWHMPIILIFKKFSFLSYFSLWEISIIFTIILLFISSLSYYFIEKAGFKYRRKLDKTLYQN